MLFFLALLAVVLCMIFGAIYTKWEEIEAMLAKKMGEAMSKELGTTVTIEKLTMRPLAGQCGMRGITLANGPGEWDAPYFMRLEEAHVVTSGGFKGFVTLPGLASVPCFEGNTFKVGFDTRAIDTISVSGARVHIEAKEKATNNDFLKAMEAKQKAAKQAKLQKKRKADLEWMLKWAADDDKPKLEKRYSQYAEEEAAEEAEEEEKSNFEFLDALKAGGPEALKAKISAKYNKVKEEKKIEKMKKEGSKAADGEKMMLGKLTISDCHIMLKGHKVRLDKPYVARAFKGTMGELKNHVALGVMQQGMSDMVEHKKEKVMQHRQEYIEKKKEEHKEFKEKVHTKVNERIELRKNQFKSMFGGKPAPEAPPPSS